MPIKVTEQNNVPQIMAVIEELSRTKLEIGIFAPEGSELFIIAMVNEYGADIRVTPKMRGFLHYAGLHLKPTTTHIKIPERSFIRAGYEHNEDAIARVVQGLLPKVIHLEMTPEQFYEFLGNYIVGKLHEFVQSVTSPRLHPFTVRGKKSSKPLIDTGRLNQSITYRVVRD